MGCGLGIEMASDLSTTTLCGVNGTFYQVGSGVMPGLPEIIAADIETCYGVIHVIDEVLVPDDPDGDNATCISNETESIADIACTDPNFSLLCGLIKQAGMGDLLAGGLFTIFAPSNEVFQTASIDLEDNRVITTILLQHIVWGSVVYSQDLSCGMTVSMANDENNTIACKDCAFFVGGPGNNVNAVPGIVSADIDACNGVIHGIDDVILPGIYTGNSTGNDNNTTGNETTYMPCGICGEGLMMSLADATMNIPDSVGLLAQQDNVTCAMAEGFCQTGACSPETCDAFAGGISESCGCTPAVGMEDQDISDSN